MAVLRPGEFALTDEAVKLCGLEKGAKILDIGCGKGDTVAHLNAMGYDACGIDLSASLIAAGKLAHPDIDIQEGDGEFLEMFSSFSFDCVMMECTLSLINMQTEALHEAWCVLKKGGKLILTDLYTKDPKPEDVMNMIETAHAAMNRPKQEGDCESGLVQYPSEYCLDGAFVMDVLTANLEDVGYKQVKWYDKTKELRDFAAKVIMEYGSLDHFYETEGAGEKSCKFCGSLKQKKLGYFLLSATKPE